jgi:hypothetical protein
MNKHLHLTTLLAGAIALSPLAAVAGNTAVQELDRVTVDLDMPFPEDPQQVAELLQRVEENAIDIRESAVRVIAFNAVPAEYTWLTHAWRWNRAAERLTELEQAFDRLQHNTDMLLDGQRAAIELIDAEIMTLSDVIDEATTYLEATRSDEFDARYSELANHAFESADSITDAARLAESLGEVRQHMNELGVLSF